MPTYGWIYEDANDYAYWPPTVLKCQECGAICDSSAELRQHYGQKHPLAMPTVYLCGAHAGREPIVRSLDAGFGVAVVAATSCAVSLDGAPQLTIKPLELEEILRSNPSSTVLVRLSNCRSSDGSKVESECIIRMRVPDETALSQTDRSFNELLVGEHLAHADVAKFVKALPRGVGDREYGAALGDYAVAIMMKSSPDDLRSDVGFAEFQAKMKGALGVLEQFKRPLAHAVTNAIRFNLNGFSRPVEPVLTRLDRSLGLFVSLTNMARDWDPGEASSDVETGRVLPVDQVTSALVDATAGLSARPENVVEAMERLEGAGQPTSEQDLRKVQVLLAEGQMRAGLLDDARTTVEGVQFDPTFRSWAERRLEEISERAS